jgi:hypothetical protein
MIVNNFKEVLSFFFRLKVKSAKKKVYVVEEDEDDYVDTDDGTLTAPIHGTSYQYPPLHPYRTYPAQQYPVNPPYNPRVSYANPKRKQYARNR